ncbi:hypothetical protein DFH06DRAFT_1185273 [Mycena polygramma]|nr:hypothetical protein DFH06DRAFT_1185273 [Mycena polygramma]
MSTRTKTPPPLSARESVFQLSSLASLLRDPWKDSPQVAVRPDYESEAPNHWQPPTAKFLNHLSACLTRGENRVVAVTVGPVGVNGTVSVSVISSPTNSPSSSQTLTSCSVQAVSGQSNATAVREADSFPESPDRDEKGNVVLWTLPPAETASAILDSLLRGDFKNAIRPSAFPDYVRESFTLLRAAALRIKTTPAEAPRIREALCIYFVGQCENKMKSRARAIGHHYPLDLLEVWSPPPGEELPHEHITIENDYLARSLHDNTVPHTGSSFLFSRKTANIWWAVMIGLVSTLTSRLDIAAEDRKGDHIATLTGYSICLHTALRKIPGALWKSTSLILHLVECLKNREPVGDEEAGKPPQEVIDAMPLGFPLPAGVPHGLALFLRAINSICVWTTGPPILLNSIIHYASIPVNVSVVDLPRAPVHAYPPKEIVARWARIEKWEDAVQISVLNALKETAIEPDDGACHCEAALMTSVILRANTKAKPEFAEPICLIRAFESMDASDIAMESRFAVGVAKKCCTVCKMLGDILQDRYWVKFDLPGGDSTLRPWVPPHWLPDAVTADLEKRLVGVVRRMVEVQGCLLDSRDSTPGSAGGSPEISGRISGLADMPILKM